MQISRILNNSKTKDHMKLFSFVKTAIFYKNLNYNSLVNIFEALNKLFLY